MKTFLDGVRWQYKEIAEILIKKMSLQQTFWAGAVSIVENSCNHYCYGWQFLGRHTDNTGLWLVWIYFEKKMVFSAICRIAKKSYIFGSF